jgi:hypothetical protein
MHRAGLSGCAGRGAGPKGLREELIHRRSWAARAEARSAIVDDIEVFYNLSGAPALRAWLPQPGRLRSTPPRRFNIPSWGARPWGVRAGPRRDVGLRAARISKTSFWGSARSFSGSVARSPKSGSRSAKECPHSDRRMAG